MVRWGSDYGQIEHEANVFAATLRWIEYTERRAIIVISRDGFILWARSSKSAYRSGIFFKTSNSSPISIPEGSLAAGLITTENQRQGLKLPAGVWFNENCEEMVIFSELYDFTISIIQFENNLTSYIYPTDRYI